VRRLILATVGLVASGVALYLVLRSVDLEATVQILVAASPLPLVAALVPLFGSMVLRSWRWQRLLPGPPSLLRILPVLLVGYLGNAVLPARLGEPIRAYLLARRESLSSAAVFGTVILERVLDLATLALMAFVATLLIAAPSWLTQLTAVAAALAISVVALLVFVGISPLVRLIHRLVGPEPGAIVGRLLGPLERFAMGVAGGARRSSVAQAFAISIPVWLADTATCSLVGRSLGIELTPAESLIIVAVGALGTSIPSAPGYIGTYELAVSGAAGAFGVAPETALAFAVLLHAVTLVPIAIAGAASLVMMGGGSLGSLARASELERGSPG
jgi:glycosyltransferase 2 family protein